VSEQNFGVDTPGKLKNWKSEKLTADRTCQQIFTCPGAGEGVRFRTTTIGQNRRSLDTENIADAVFMPATLGQTRNFAPSRNEDSKDDA
jgi:hypothetical protein